MFNVLDLLDSTIKEALKSNGRCSVKHATAENGNAVTYISISRSLNEDLIPKTTLVLDQEDHGKNTTLSLNYLDANNYLMLNVFFEDDSCFKGITVYADNGEPVHELASKIANSFIASGKTAIFPLLERADIQAANKSRITHTTFSSSDGQFVTQMSIAKGFTANDKRKMSIILIQDGEIGTTIFSVEFIEGSDITCNIFLCNGDAYNGIQIRDEDPAVSRAFAWKLINKFLEHGEAALLEILSRQNRTVKNTLSENLPAVELRVYHSDNIPNKLSFKICSKRDEKTLAEVCEKLINVKERETIMQKLLFAIEKGYIKNDKSPSRNYNAKHSHYLFPEMRIEIPASYEEAAFFTLCRADNLKLSFRLSGRKSIEARARQLLDIIDSFTISPEKLALCHKSLLVDSTCPVSQESLLHVANLYHCNRKLSPQNGKVTLLCSDDSINVTFTRQKKNGLTLNLITSFKNNELRISITKKRYFFTHTRKFSLPFEFLDNQENIDTMLVAFYNEKDGSVDKCGLKSSLLVYFLQSRSQLPEDSQASSSGLLLAS